MQITKALASPYEDKSALAAKYGFALTNEANELFEDETIDVIVELIGKIDPAKAFISAALENKKHVVTANKDLIATHGPELLAIAEKPGCLFIMKPAWVVAFRSCAIEHPLSA